MNKLSSQDLLLHCHATVLAKLQPPKKPREGFTDACDDSREAHVIRTEHIQLLLFLSVNSAPT